MLLPQAEGPLQITKTPGPHAVVLADPLTGEPYQSGNLVATTRLIKFRFPPEWATAPLGSEDTSDESMELRVGDMVAVEVRINQNPRIHVASVRRVFPLVSLVEAQLWHVPSHERYGPWSCRKWVALDRSEVVPFWRGAGESGARGRCVDAG